MGQLDCATIGMAEIASVGAVTVSPNPCSSVLTVSLPNGANLQEIALYDATGRSVPVEANGRSIDLSALRAGLYTLVAEVDGRMHRVRVVKE